ncbi:hypothetical protein BJY01DRAFT_254393 [Aspergillus pseudoustus]|uniref:EthD domain-containing protein n=1 Tax=Aspergillus pseudoustus TaxID=1810923 RepID=A0ABR4ITV9_9EURO
MPATTTVLYPNVENLELDIQKYLHGHAPQVLKLMGPYGLKAVRAVKLHTPPWAADAGTGYALQVQLDWENIEQFHTAFKMTSDVLMADIDSFSNTKPLVMTGDVILERKVEQ